MSIAMTIAQIREFDRLASQEYGVPTLELMENAGRGVAQFLLGVIEDRQRPLAIVCGKGNNGGDGFVVARYLYEQGIDVSVYLTCAPEGYQDDAATNLARLFRQRVAIHVANEAQAQIEFQRTLTDCEWAVDAILGVGAYGSPRPPADTLIRHLNQSTAKRLAVDLPSGLHADSGQAETPTVLATATCTLLAPKPGLLTPSSQEFVGTLHVIDLGAPPELMRRFGLPGLEETN